MTKLFNNLTSAELGKRLENLRGELAKADSAVKEHRTNLEEALAGSKPSEKPLADLATARSKMEALHSVISSAEKALAEAEGREEMERRRKAIAALADRFESVKAELEKRKTAIFSAVAELEKAEADFDSAAEGLKEVLSAVGIASLRSLVPSGAAYADPVRTWEADSNLNSALSRIGSEIDNARKE